MFLVLKQAHTKTIWEKWSYSTLALAEFKRFVLLLSLIYPILALMNVKKQKMLIIGLGVALNY